MPEAARTSVFSTSAALIPDQTLSLYCNWLFDRSSERCSASFWTGKEIICPSPLPLPLPILLLNHTDQPWHNRRAIPAGCCVLWWSHASRLLDRIATACKSSFLVILIDFVAIFLPPTVKRTSLCLDVAVVV